MADCPFCRIIEAGYYGDRTPDAVAFEPLDPVTPGHLLVVSRRHIPDAGCDPAVTAATMHLAAMIAGQLDSANIITSLGAAATQTVFHLHIHVVPRRPGDGLVLPWGGPSGSPSSFPTASFTAGAFRR